MRSLPRPLFALLATTFALTASAPAHAQVCRPSEQFMTLSFGTARTSLNPPAFTWVDKKFADGLVLPREDNQAITFELSAGAMRTTRLAILGGFEIPAANEPWGDAGPDAGRLWNLHFYGGVRYWPLRRLWVEGGVGPAYTVVAWGEGEEKTDSGNWGLGWVGVVGVDLLQKRDVAFPTGHIALHVQARGVTSSAHGVRQNTIGLLFGFQVGY